MASGGKDIKHIDNKPRHEANVLYGAVVAGPNKDDKFYDIRSDWVETKVARRIIFFDNPLLSVIRCTIGCTRLQRAYAHARGDACPE